MASVKQDGRKKQKRYYYSCANHRKKVCSSKPLTATYIENVVLDIVIEVINNTNLEAELKSSINELIALEEGILAKNQVKLSRSKNQLDSYIIKSTNPDTPVYLMNQYELRIAEIVKDIEMYNNIIKTQEHKIEKIKNNTKTTITKDELLSNRLLARSIIRDIVKQISYDESTGDIEIELL